MYSYNTAVRSNVQRRREWKICAILPISVGWQFGHIRFDVFAACECRKKYHQNLQYLDAKHVKTVIF